MTDETRGDEPQEPTADEAAEETPAAEQPAAPEEQPAAEPEPADTAPVQEPVIEADVAAVEPADEDVEYVEETPRVKPEIPGMDLEVDIVREGEEALREDEEDEYGDTEADAAEEDFAQPIADAAIDLAAGARYTATGKRKTAVARVILKPGTGAYVINGRTLEQHFPRFTLQRNIRQPLEQVGYDSRMDVVATMHGGGVSAQAVGSAKRDGFVLILPDQFHGSAESPKKTSRFVRVGLGKLSRRSDDVRRKLRRETCPRPILSGLLPAMCASVTRALPIQSTAGRTG
jgi:small subunit ribosomal protein S9